MIILFAATMSSIDSYLYSQSSILSQSLMKTKKNNVILIIRLLMLFLITLSTITAIFIADLTKGSFIFVSLAVIVAIPTILTWINNKIDSKIIVIALIVGSMFFVFSVVQGLLTNNLTPEIVLRAMIGSFIGLGVGWVCCKFIK